MPFFGGSSQRNRPCGGEPDVYTLPFFLVFVLVCLSEREPAVFLPMQLFSLCTATETSCHEFCPHRNLNRKPTMRFITSVPAFFKAPNNSSYEQQMLHIYYYNLHINTNIYIG